MYNVKVSLGDGSHTIGSSAPKLNPCAIKVTIVDDNHLDAQIMTKHLNKACRRALNIKHFTSLKDFLADDVESPDVVILDRMMPDSILGEARIREIRARHSGCGVVLNTGNVTPSLRSTAAHEGAIAVIEKGTLDAESIKLLVMSAAAIGPQMKLQ